MPVVILENVGLAAFALFWMVVGFVILTKQERAAKLLRVGRSLESPIMGFMSLIMAAFILVTLIMRLTGQRL
jgi:hypothetical protein